MAPEEVRIEARRGWLKRAAAGVVGTGAMGLVAGPAIAAARPIFGPARALGEADGRGLILSSRKRLALANGTLTPSATLGPYYLAGMPVRQDITGGQTGLPLTLFYRVVSAATGQPIQGRAVDVWHANSCGIYSGYSAQGTLGQNWLRGVQVTGADGWVRFDTIFPGWYVGRTAHIHARVRQSLTSTQGLTTQFFFDAMTDYPQVQINDTIYNFIAPYGTCGAPRPTTNAQDGIYNPLLSQIVYLRQDGVLGLVAGLIVCV